MAWITIDFFGNETIWENKPIRSKSEKCWMPYGHVSYGMFVEVPKGTAEKLTGRDLDWDDEPIKLE